MNPILANLVGGFVWGIVLYPIAVSAWVSIGFIVAAITWAEATDFARWAHEEKGASRFSVWFGTIVWWPDQIVYTYRIRKIRREHRE